MMGPYCNFCGRRCFARLPADTPQEILQAYGRHAIAGTQTIAATCPEGQRFEKERLGYCWDDIQAALYRQAVAALVKAVDQLLRNARDCDACFVDEDSDLYDPEKPDQMYPDWAAVADACAKVKERKLC